MSNKNAVKSAMESMMFVWGEPLDAKMAADALDLDRKTAHAYFRELMLEYEEAGRGIVIRERDGAFQFVTRPENYDYLRRLCTPVRERRLSQAALEVLAIIAYKQPVTKSEIDVIRGVKCERVLDGLIKKELVEEVGRSDAVGRPVLYGTTQTFLRHFDLESLRELPEIEDIEGAIHERDAADSDAPEQIAIELKPSGAFSPGEPDSEPAFPDAPPEENAYETEV